MTQADSYAGEGDGGGHGPQCFPHPSTRLRAATPQTSYGRMCRWFLRPHSCSSRTVGFMLGFQQLCRWLGDTLNPNSRAPSCCSCGPF